MVFTDTFVYGVFGSAIVEVVSAWHYTNNDGAGDLPPKYKRFSFWLIRVILAIMAGLLAEAYGIKSNPILAINIGASTPLIVKALGENIPKNIS